MLIDEAGDFGYQEEPENRYGMGYYYLGVFDKPTRGMGLPVKWVSTKDIVLMVEPDDR